MPHNINVIIAEDHPTFSYGIEQGLLSLKDIVIIGKASNGKQLMQLLNSHSPDLILMDVMMPYMTGIEASEQIRKRYPAIKIIFISMYEDEHVLNQCKVWGDGYIPKATTVDDLLKAIDMVIYGCGKCYLKAAPEPTVFINSDDLTKKYKLTKRETELIKLLKDGKTTKEIARELFLSTFTIETHRKNILRKLEVKNIAELVAFAIRNKIV